MIDINKIRAEIDKQRLETEQTDWAIGFNLATKTILRIIDTAIAEQRVPSGEWKRDGYHVACWVHKHDDYWVCVELHCNGTYESIVRPHGQYEKELRSEHPTLIAAQLAAEEAMKKMEEKS